MMTQDLWESNRSCAAGSSLAESALGTDVLARSVRWRGVTVSADGDLELAVLSVRCRLLNRVDHQQFDGAARTFELQPELFPDVSHHRPHLRRRRRSFSSRIYLKTARQRISNMTCASQKKARRANAAKQQRNRGESFARVQTSRGGRGGRLTGTRSYFPSNWTDHSDHPPIRRRPHVADTRRCAAGCRRRRWCGAEPPGNQARCPSRPMRPAPPADPPHCTPGLRRSVPCRGT